MKHGVNNGQIATAKLVTIRAVTLSHFGKKKLVSYTKSKLTKRVPVTLRLTLSVISDSGVENMNIIN